MIRVSDFFLLPNCVVNEPLDLWLCMIFLYLVLYYGLSDWRGWFFSRQVGLGVQAAIAIQLSLA